MSRLLKLSGLLLYVLLSPNLAEAQNQTFNIDGKKYLYSKPNAFDFILNIPASYKSFGERMFISEHTVSNILIGTTTALFIVYDQQVYDKVSLWGRKMGIGNGDDTKTILSIGGYPLFRGPTNLGSAMYFLGDGWTHLGLGISFLTAGLINNDYRALQTSSQIAQGMLSVGITIQLLKHITGRETPNRATQNAGIWRFFPNQTDYHKQVPKYDAFPSGHLATAMMTLTVIAENYDEFKWIRPVGYGLMTLLSFQMINNGVHWISDYPLALGVGYLFGKIAVESGRSLVENTEPDQKFKISISPLIGISDTFGLRVNMEF